MAAFATDRSTAGATVLDFHQIPSPADYISILSTRSGEQTQRPPKSLRFGGLYVFSRLFGSSRAWRAGRTGLSQIRLGSLGRLLGPDEGERRILAGALAVPVVDVDCDKLTRSDLLEQDLLAQGVLDLPLDRAPQRPRTQHRIEATLGQQGLGLVRQLHGHVLALELLLHPTDHQVDHPDDLVASQLMEDDDVVDAVEELRAEVLLQLVVDLLLHPLVVVLATTLGEAQPDRLGDVGCAEVAGEDQHGVLEVDRAALTVGETTVLEHLQQAVVDLLVGLLDLVEQNDRERLAPHLLGELAAFLVADVPGRGTE